MSNTPVTRIDLAPLGGIAGDMFAAAMFSAFPELYQHFCNDLKALEVNGLSVTLDDRMSKGMQAKYFNVLQDTVEKPPRTLAGVTEFLQSKPLADEVAQPAIGIFTLLARAEAEVHGKTIDTIHFHEVSDWDSVIDIVAAAGVITRLACPVWRVGALPLGGGTVNTAHGDIAVPAPATLALLKDFHWHDDGESGERVTPTGAAIIAYLEPLSIDTVVSAASLCAAGSGCGSRELSGRANILRITAFSDPVNKAGISRDQVLRVAFEVDDMTAEELAWATDKLRDTNGVQDVSCVSMQAKKGRTATGIRIIAASSAGEEIIDKCFTLTSTIGVRCETVQRFILNRSEHTVDGTSVKVVSRSAQTQTGKTSSDDLAACNSLAERRQTAEQNRDKALQTIEPDK